MASLDGMALTRLTRRNSSWAGLLQQPAVTPARIDEPSDERNTPPHFMQGPMESCCKRRMYLECIDCIERCVVRLHGLAICCRVPCLPPAGPGFLGVIT